MKRVITILIIVGVLGVIAFRLASNKKQINAKNKMPETTTAKIAVNVATVQSKTIEKNLSVVGTVIPDKEIEIKSEVQGKITALNFDLGDFVKKGQVLARIDADIKTIGVSTAEQNLANAKRDFERYSNLYKGGAATEAQYQQYKLNYENASNVLRQARKELTNTNIIAPISGYISNKQAESGAFANIASPIATIVDVSKLKVQLTVAERDVYSLQAGDKVNITTTVYPGVTFEGKITFISPRGDDAHNYPVEISIDNQNKNPLKAGTYVSIVFSRKSTVPSLQIPRDALVGSIQNAQVYIVENNKAIIRKVTLGTDAGSTLEVLDGLKEGETVVTTGQINLSDGAEVSVIK